MNHFCHHNLILSENIKQLKMEFDYNPYSKANPSLLSSLLEVQLKSLSSIKGFLEPQFFPVSHVMQ